MWLPARDIVEAAISGATSIDPSGEIILLETGCPWKEHLYDLEKDMALKTPIKYVLYGVRPSLFTRSLRGIKSSAQLQGPPTHDHVANTLLVAPFYGSEHVHSLGLLESQPCKPTGGKVELTLSPSCRIKTAAGSKQ